MCKGGEIFEEVAHFLVSESGLEGRRFTQNLKFQRELRLLLIRIKINMEEMSVSTARSTTGDEN